MSVKESADKLAEMAENMEAFAGELAAAIAEDDANGSPFWVVGFPQHGVFCKVGDTLPDGRVKNMRTAGVLFATLMGRDDAERATANGNIRNGNGETAEPVPYGTALRIVLANVEGAAAMFRRERDAVTA